jgi:hypothetical protein
MHVKKVLSDSKEKNKLEIIDNWGPILENNGMPLSIQKKLICKESGMP